MRHIWLLSVPIQFPRGVPSSPVQFVRNNDHPSRSEPIEISVCQHPSHQSTGQGRSSEQCGIEKGPPQSTSAPRKWPQPPNTPRSKTPRYKKTFKAMATLKKKRKIMKRLRYLFLRVGRGMREGGTITKRAVNLSPFHFVL